VFVKILFENKLDDSLLPRLGVAEDEANPCWLVVGFLFKPTTGHSQISVNAVFFIRGPNGFLYDFTQSVKFHGLCKRN
jgi:hypothetical protein